MNTPSNTRIVRKAAALVALSPITFTGLDLMARDALPGPAQASALMQADASPTPQR
jgi:hypothetical protein